MKRFIKRLIVVVLFIPAVALCMFELIYYTSVWIATGRSIDSDPLFIKLVDWSSK